MKIKIVTNRDEVRLIKNELSNRYDVISVPRYVYSYYTCYDKNNFVGFFTFRKYNRHLIELRHFTVLKKYRCKGYGTKMIKWIIKKLKKDKFKKLIITTRLDNYIALSFFSKNNFVIEGILKNHYRDNGDVVLMAYHL